MIPVIHAAAVAGFGALMAAAAFEDFRRYTIPNWLTLGLCALWPAYLVGAPGLMTVLTALACAAAVFLVGLVLFARGYVGGGDVKLLAAAMLWAGPAAAPGVLILTGLIGGVLSLAILSPFGAYLISGARAHLGPAAMPETANGTMPVPYGVAIAAASLIVILPSQFG